MKTPKKLLSLFLVICMLMSFAPVRTFAAEAEQASAPAAAAESTPEAADDDFGEDDTAVDTYESVAAEDESAADITLLVGETYDLGTLTGDFRDAAKDYGPFRITQTGFTPVVPGQAAADPEAAEMSTLVSGGEYLLSDGSGNYLSFSAPSTIVNSTDPLTATKWTVTVNSDGTYAFSTTYEQWGTTATAYLAQQDWGTYGLAVGSSALGFTYSPGTGFLFHLENWERDNDYYLEYDGSGWTLTMDKITGSAAAVYTQATPGTADTPAATSLLLTAVKAGSASVTIGGTVYNVTVTAPLSSARCEEHNITVSGRGVNGLTCAADGSVTAITGYASVTGVRITGYSLTPDVDGAVYKGEITVKMPVPEEWTGGGIIQAFLMQDGAAAAIPAAIADGYAAFTVPGGSVCGLFQLPAGYFTEEVNILMGNDSTTTRILSGAYTTDDVYYCDESGLVSVTAEVTTPYTPAVPAGPVSAIDAGSSYYIADGNGNYLTVDHGAMANTTDAGSAAVWKCASTDNGTYCLWSGGYQLVNRSDEGSVFKLSASGGGWYASPSFDAETGLSKNGLYLVFSDGAWTTAADSAGHGIVYGFGSDAVPPESIVTVTSKEKTGAASVIVGTTKYNITVADKSLVDTTLTVYSMITNDLVLIGGSDGSPVCHVDINAAMPGIDSEDGIDITALFPTGGRRKNDTTVFWKMTWLPYGNHQGTETGSPYTDAAAYAGGVAGSTDGMTDYARRVDFSRLRFRNSRWEFYLDSSKNAWYTGEKWGIDQDGDGIRETDGWYPVSPAAEDITALGMPGIEAGEGQVVAYYLQVTDVTREVTTNVADWGPAIDDSRNIGYGGNYVLLDFAVRYEDGVRSPSENGTFPYADGGFSADGERFTADKTMGFHCSEGWGGVEKKEDGTLWRTVKTILATTDQIRGYEIYMITATRSSASTPLSAADMSQNKRLPNGDGTYTGGYNYDTSTETIVWLKDEDVSYDAGTYQVDPDVAYGYRENGTHTNGVPLVDSVTIQNRNALLITYYIRYVGSASDDLHVHYINRTLNNVEFYTYGIHVPAGVVFDAAFARAADTEYDLTGNMVENYYGVTQTVQGDPRNILDVPSFYRSTKLTLVEVRRSEDGKDVYLYYDTDNAKDMVIDFGLPVEITAASMQLSLDARETVSTIASLDGADSRTVEGQYYVQRGAYGRYYTDLTSGRCYYVPTSVMRGTETVRLAVATNMTSETNPHRYVHSIYPATTMYYEQYFAAFEGAWTGMTEQPAVGAGYIGSFIGSQQSAYPGMTGANNYGYDGVYTNAEKTGAATAAVGARAAFEFTGDGFEIYADCTESTGTVMVALYSVNADTETMKSVYMVNTVRKSGESGLTAYSGDSHNTPIVSVRDLPHGDYRVVMLLTGYAAPYFIFDGFRIFNTMGRSIDDAVYAKDAEAQPEFAEIRDSVLVAKLPVKETIDKKSIYLDQIAEDVSGQVYTLRGDRPIQAVLLTESKDALADAVVTDYLDNGTKNEVYVRPGQSLVITLPGEAIAAKAQIGMKTLTGSATLGTATVSETNMYYTGMSSGSTITIQVPPDGVIISVTDLKIPGGIPAGSAADALSVRSGIAGSLLWMGYRQKPESSGPEAAETAVTAPEITEPAAAIPEDTYVPGNIYRRGDTVVYNGKSYRARWWTQGKNPETSQVWEPVDGSQAGAPAAGIWSPFRIYTAGMRAAYKGHVYEARRWTLGFPPSTGRRSAWKQI